MRFYRRFSAAYVFTDMNSYFEKAGHETGTETLLPKGKCLLLLTCSGERTARDKETQSDTRHACTLSI